MDLIKEFIKLFITREYSFTSKFIVIAIIILSSLFINDFLGFTFYYSNNQKITQLKNIEEIKKINPNNKQLINTLDLTEQEIINRKSYLDAFIYLFTSKQIDKIASKKKESNDTIYIIKQDTLIIRDLTYSMYSKNDKILHFNKDSSLCKKDTILNSEMKNNKLKPNGSLKNDSESNKNNTIIQNSRSQIWHTISSSLFLIIILLILIILPFTQGKIDKNIIFGSIILIIFDAFLIWVFQYLLGLIPLINNNPIWNYILNITAQLVIIFIIKILIDFNDKRSLSKIIRQNKL